MKTFEALEISACVASGLAWHGRAAVQSGAVVYVAAEGVAGLGKRIRAWRHAHEGADLSRLWVIGEALNLMSRVDVDTFVTLLSALPDRPALIVLDTLARCMVGGDENSSRDMGLVVESLEAIKSALGATVLVVHHMGRQGDHERGSTALRGASDVMMKMEPDSGTVVLSCSKMKDAEDFGPLVFKLRTVDGMESCVLEPVDEHASDQELTPNALALLKLLDTHFGGEPVAPSTWLKVSTQPDRTFWRGARQLTKGGYVGKVKGKYALTTAGRELLGIPPAVTTATTAMSLPNAATGSDEAAEGVTNITAMTVPPPPFRGGNCHGSNEHPPAGPVGSHGDSGDEEDQLPW